MCSYHFFIVRSHSPIPTIPIKTLIYPPQNRSLAQPAWCEGHLSISVARTPPQRLLTDTLQLWGPARVSPWDARCRLRVTFSGEPAVDAGGPFREWLVALSQALVTATTGDPEKAHPRFEPSSWAARGGGRSSSGLGRSTTRVIAGVEYERANDRVGWSRVRRDADVESLLAGGGSSDDSDNDDDEFRDDTMSDDAGSVCTASGWPRVSDARGPGRIGAARAGTRSYRDALLSVTLPSLDTLMMPPPCADRPALVALPVARPCTEPARTAPALCRGRAAASRPVRPSNRRARQGGIARHPAL